MSDVPLAARMRPRTFDEFVGQTHVVGPGTALTKLVDGGNLPSIILWGPAGTGKTTLAHLLADQVGADLMQLSAVSSGVADARKVMEGAKGGLFRTVLFVDEVHRWSKAQQDVLLPAVEAGTVTLIGATTENPYFSLNTPLLSRCLLLRLEPLGPDELEALMRRALDDPERGLGAIDVKVDGRGAGPSRRDRRRRRADGPHRPGGGRARGAGLRRARGHARPAAEAVQRKAVVYDRQGDAHYDVISRVHQEHPRLGSGRRAVLAGAHARGRGGRPVHRAPDDRARVGGHRARRPAGAADRRRPPRTRSSTSGCRRRGSTWRRRRSTWPAPPSPTASTPRSARRWRTPRAPIRCRCTCGIRPTREPSGWAREGLQVPTRLPRSPGRAGVPAGQVPGDAYYEPSGEGED